ncbi:hypothetical protein ABVT39_000260 [Epinephelus coioides]
MRRCLVILSNTVILQPKAAAFTASAPENPPKPAESFRCWTGGPRGGEGREMIQGKKEERELEDNQEGEGESKRMMKKERRKQTRMLKVGRKKTESGRDGIERGRK